MTRATPTTRRMRKRTNPNLLAGRVPPGAVATAAPMSVPSWGGGAAVDVAVPGAPGRLDINSQVYGPVGAFAWNPRSQRTEFPNAVRSGIRGRSPADQPARTSGSDTPLECLLVFPDEEAAKPLQEKRPPSP